MARRPGRSTFGALAALAASGWLAVGCGSEPEPEDGTTGGSGGGGCLGCSGGRGGVGTGSSSGSGGASGGTGGAPSPLAPESCPDPDAKDPGVERAPAEDAAVSVTLRLSQVGYDAGGPKRGVVEASGALTEFQVVSVEDDVVRFEGELEASETFDEWRADIDYFVADFSELARPGRYVLRVNGVDSEEFELAEQLLFDSTIADVLGYFRASRADDPAVWAADENVPLFGGGGEVDVRGGWYDASGDISKYLSHLSYANFLNPQQIPLTAWSLAWARDEAGPLFEARGLDDELVAEALYGADYLVRAQSAAGYFYINVFDHWTGELAERDVCAFERGNVGGVWDSGVKTSEYQAAFREGGGLAVAALARIAAWGQSGSFPPADYLDAAERGFAHLEDSGASYCDDGKENIIDDYAALLAASELFLATDEQSYLTAARARAVALEERLHPSGYFIADDGDRPFWHASDAGLPVLALLRYAGAEPDAARRSAAEDAVATHLDYLLAVTTDVPNPYAYARQHYRTGGAIQSGFFIPHDNESGYWWQGESARQGSLAAAALLGARALGREGCFLGVEGGLAAYATSQLDWILGKNPYGVSMLAGHGSTNPPPYGGGTVHGHLTGGISNGITGRDVDGGGIQWTREGAGEPWEDWRWTEQWLPHSTWFFVAVTAAALD